MPGTRAEQKAKTRQRILTTALSQLSADQSFTSLSLREVAREAGLAATSFYRHFKDMEELGLALIDETGLTLRQLMRSARKRFDNQQGVISISIETFMEYVDNNPELFRLLLSERTGTSKTLRKAINREIEHFISELTDYLLNSTDSSQQMARIQAEAIVTIVFNNGAEYLDASKAKKQEIIATTKTQLRFLAHGAAGLQQSSD
ncbi:MAG: HTH-type transcriptional repressor FabR [Kangiellaceae bacterium]|jgi:AcrR family transcriptional regulator|nr:HTH-type transcriptional repressor FabR [Kangiellaceae bacterium]